MRADGKALRFKLSGSLDERLRLQAPQTPVKGEASFWATTVDFGSVRSTRNPTSGPAKHGRLDEVSGHLGRERGHADERHNPQEAEGGDQSFRHGHLLRGRILAGQLWLDSASLFDALRVLPSPFAATGPDHPIQHDAPGHGNGEQKSYGHCPRIARRAGSSKLRQP